MINPTLRITLLLLSFFLCTKHWSQGVSHRTGFYSENSLFFTVDTVLKPNLKKEISVNCFTDQVCFVPYTGGIWLYNRNNHPNTWENQKLTGKSTDTLPSRGLLDKVNVVKVRIKDERGNIVFEKAHFIGLVGKGAKNPYSVPVVHLLVDSADLMGKHGFYGPGEGITVGDEHFWNYNLDRGPLFSGLVSRDRIEKKCVMEIISPDNRSFIYQHCGIRVSGNSSREYPNRSLAVVARDEYSGKNRFKTDLLGPRASYKWLRFRAGGSSQHEAFSSHEIMEKIITGLKIGEVNTQPVITFLNGSYWSLGFAQDRVQEYTIERIFGIDHDDISIIRPLYIPLDSLPPFFLKHRKINTSDFIMVKNHDHKSIIIGLLEKGTKGLFTKPARMLYSAASDTTQKLTFREIDSLIDVHQWITYMATMDYAGLTYLSNGIVVATAPGKKMFPILNEGDYFGTHSPYDHHLKEVYPQLDNDISFSSLVFGNIILKNEECVNLFILRYEDLLNTWFAAKRTTSIVDDVSKSYMQEYGKHQKSWKSNVWKSVEDQKKMLANIRNYCIIRPDFAWQHLAKFWKKDHYTPVDRKQVSLVMDSITANLISVKINSLSHDTSYTGMYYPNPAIRVSVDAQKLSEGTYIQWKEYPDSAMNFNINPVSNISLTPILRRGNNDKKKKK